MLVYHLAIRVGFIVAFCSTNTCSWDVLLHYSPLLTTKSLGSRLSLQQLPPRIVWVIVSLEDTGKDFSAPYRYILPLI
ncbi:hypothetical protein GGI42DRAFT_331743 [Trichoderma sp. SZMC 28013]